MLSVGIVGLPNVGKSTLFNALLKKQQAYVANYPFATIEPNVGIVPVPEERLERLAALVQGEEKMKEKPPLVPALIKFVDIAGLVRGASKGEGLGNQFLGHIREVGAIVEVVRAFGDENVIRSGAVAPQADMAVVDTELMLSDLEVATKRLETLAQESRRGRDAVLAKKKTVLEKVKGGLEQGHFVRQLSLSDEEQEQIRDLNLLTNKPLIYVLNVDESSVSNPRNVSNISNTGNSPVLSVCAKLEAELAELGEAEQTAYLRELGLAERGLDKVIRAAYDVLNLITFFTAGPKEVHAWAVRRGDKAPRAAGVIHSDFERGFIAAEVIGGEELLALGSYHQAKETGKLRLEGRDYEVQDGDVIEFRFSV